MTGLLEKARQLRTSLGFPEDGRDEFAYDPESGISREEQKQIRAEIERVATENRMSVSPEMFAVKAAKRGVLFPVAVNIAAIVALAAGLALFYFLFQRGESELSRGDTGTITAEGQLLAEVRKESEAKLVAKNQQINQIQGRLSEIDKQRQDLQANMDSKVRDRENELRAAMSAELEAEKARLQKQGLSDQDIEGKLADMEKQQNSALTKQLDTFKTQAEADRLKSEATLKSLQAQFTTDLAKANSERQQVLSESKQRESDLQAQLAQKTRELQASQAQTQAQLATLSSQKQQEDLVSQQLVGLYAVAQADIAARNYSKAITSLQAIGNYVNATDIAALPGIARRRPVDLFIVDSLTSLVQGEMDKGTVDTASLVNAANQIADVRANVAEADVQVRAGKLAEAEKLYQQAIAVIPEIAKSYAWFTGKAKEAETARQDALRAGLGRAEAAFTGARYSDTLAAYREAFAYLPEASARLDATLANIAAGGAAMASQRAQADQTSAAASSLGQADSLFREGRLTDAVAQYLSLLSSYPRSTQAAQAVKGIADSVAALNVRAAADLKSRTDQVNALSDQVASLQIQLDAGLAEVLAVKKSIVGLLGLKQDPAAIDSASLLKTLNDRYGDLAAATTASADLRKSLDAAAKKNADLGVQVTRLDADNARLASELSAAQKEAEAQRQEAERQRKLAEQAAAGMAAGSGAGGGAAGAGAAAAGAAVTTAGVSTTVPSGAEDKKLAEFETLVAAYLAYAKQEDDNLAKYGQQKALMLSVGGRDGFLASLGKLFDGLLGRVKRYESQSATDGIDTGRKSALDDVIGLMTGLANQKTAETQKSFLEKRLAAEKDPRMKSLLGYLQRVVANR
jgi:hypothetical protein